MVPVSSRYFFRAACWRGVARGRAPFLAPFVVPFFADFMLDNLTRSAPRRMAPAHADAAGSAETVPFTRA